MEPITNWTALWSQVVAARRSGRREPGDSRREDVWTGEAAAFDQRVRSRWEQADRTRDTLLAHVRPEDTVLDIGAGTGAWAVHLASRVARVTALEPSPSMRAILEQNLLAAEVGNVDVVDGRWPEADVDPHDLILCSHAMYGADDLVAFVDRMQAVARRRVFLVIRAPSRDSLMADAARIAWGHPHFAPDFTIAYNVLLDMGLHPDVVIERPRRRPDRSPSVEAALADVKNRLGVGEEAGPADAALTDLLRRRLVPREGRLEWPGELRSALVHWDTDAARHEDA